MIWVEVAIKNHSEPAMLDLGLVVESLVGHQMHGTFMKYLKNSDHPLKNKTYLNPIITILFKTKTILPFISLSSPLTSTIFSSLQLKIYSIITNLNTL